MKVNIIGCAPDWKAAPADGICWGFNCHILKRPYSVVFDMHDVAYEITGVRTEPWKLVKPPRQPILTESFEKCEEDDITVFSLGGMKGTVCIPYPIEEICAYFDTDYFASGACYALALAIYQGATEIDIWGIFLSAGDEWAYQKPCVEYWIGRAEGSGVKVTIHGMTRLKMNLRDRLYGYQTKQVAAN